MVITGIGAHCAAGTDTPSLWARMTSGEPGIGQIEIEGLGTLAAGRAEDPDAAGAFGRKEARRMDRVSQFAAMAATLRRLADEVCGGRLAYFLEGGYSSSGLRQGASAVLDASLAPEAPDLPPPFEAPRGSLLDQLVGRVIAVHGARYRGLGAC